jgi:cell division protein DivIC
MNWKKALGKLNNFYVIFAIAFLAWLSFFDSNDFYSQYLHREKIDQLEREAVFYQQGIKQLTEERRLLGENPKLLEKFAREKYRMKKPGEDVYIIKEK